MVVAIMIAGCGTVTPQPSAEHKYLVTYFDADSLKSQIVWLGGNELLYCIGDENVLLEKIHAKLGGVIVKSVRTIN